MIKTKYYDEEIECITSDKLKEIQLKLFNRQLTRAKNTIAYKDKLPDKINDLSEVENLPFTTKEDLKKNCPFGLLAVAMSKVARTCATSGTTGAQILFFYSMADLHNFAISKARHYSCSGLG